MNYSEYAWMKMGDENFISEVLKILPQENVESSKLEQFGQKLYMEAVTFSKFSILLDKLLETLPTDKQKYVRNNRNTLAKGYLKIRLKQEIKTLKIGIHNNPNLVTKKDLAIIDDMLLWLEQFIAHILHNEPLPDITQKIQNFIVFVEQKAGLFFEDETIKTNFLNTNRELYDAASLALEFFLRKEYFFFVLIYIELIALFLKMVTLLGSMFIEDILLSIYIDPITLLPNRFQLLKEVHTMPNLFILIVNIKNFSKINLLHGYEVGDILLKKVAAFLKIQECIKSYRIYGDEFAVLVKNEEQAHEIFQKLNNEIFIKITDVSYQIFFYGAYDKFEKLALEGCEFALMNSPKKALVNAKEIKHLVKKYENELSMTQKLKEIMIADNITPYYQPIYATGKVKKVIKYEVLMRLYYKEQILTPAEFLPTLINTPFYTEFTKTMLYKSFKMFQENDLEFSINLTTTDVKDKGVKLFLETLISKYPDVAKRLTIELLETEALSEFETINNFISYMKQSGIKFALDDFGSGYSNFTQIAKLDIDFIKIDGLIIKNITNDIKMQKLLDAILSFAKSMEIESVAEFVHNKEIFNYLQNKVSMLQGYYIGKPLPLLLESSHPFSN